MNMGIGVECPFYRWHKDDSRNNNKTIACEGLIGSDVNAMYRFSSKEAQKEWMEDYCCNDWTECPYAKLLQEYYK